jgi:cysteine desulfurase
VNFERLYLDYNATSPLSQSVHHWLKSGDLLFGNPSSQHSSGKSARKSINESRAFIFKTFNKSEKDTKLFFHSGATEAFHTFAHSFSEMARLQGRDLLICFSRLDHPAVTSLEEKFFGSHVKFFELQRDKDLNYFHESNFEALKDKKENNPDLIILYHHLWVHNETGQISPLDELNRFKSLSDLYIHVDSVQAPGKILDWRDLKVGDIWSFSSHKFGSLKGMGFSLFQKEIDFHPLMMGGSQQASLRSGTENVLGVKSISLALGDLEKVDIKNTSFLRSRLEKFMKSALAEMGDIVTGNLVASNTIYFYLNECSSDIALALFDLHGLEISAGSACSSGAAKPSPVLVQKGLHHVSKNGLRMSLPLNVSEEEIQKIEERLLVIFKRLRK